MFDEVSVAVLICMTELPGIEEMKWLVELLFAVARDPAVRVALRALLTALAAAVGARLLGAPAVAAAIPAAVIVLSGW